MSAPRPALTVTALLGCAALAAGADGGLPLAGWRVEARPGDRVELAEAAGQLRLSYQVAIDLPRRDGHLAQVVGSFRLLLAAPRAVGADERRVVFSACGLDKETQLRPLLADAQGEEFSYVPHPADLLLRRAGGWGDWRSSSFLCSEAGGAQNGIYDASGGDGNAWPDGRLALLGFEARILAKPGARASRSGTLVLARAALAGDAVAEEDPACYLDALASGAGRHRIVFTVRDAFQGAPVREQVVEAAGDPADPAVGGRRIVIDDGGLPRSWIAWRALRDGGSPATGDKRWDRDHPAAASRAAPLPAGRAPAGGHLRLDLDAGGGVLAGDAPLAATVRVFAGAGIDRLAWTLMPAGHDDVLASGEAAVAGGADPFRDLRLELPAQPGRTALRVAVRALAGGRVVEEGERLLGRAGAVQPHARAGARRTRDEVKKSPYVRLTYLPPKEPPRSEEEAAAHVRAMLDTSAPITRDVTYMIDLAQFEVLPGVYDFALLDRVMDAAAERGCGITVRLCHAESKAPYRWHPYTRPRSWDGAVVSGHAYYGAYAVTDPAFIASWLRAFRALHDRYRDHAGFQGWYVMLPSGEWNVPDMPWQGVCSGYAWSDREAFRTWLRTHGDLAALNARWGAAYAAWDQVQPPQPTFARGAEPDTRLAWLDFCRFKTALDEDWCAQAGAAIRAYDRDHVVIGYSLDGGVRLDGLPHPGVVANVDFMHNGGNHTLQWENTLTPAWSRGLGWISEPHDPHAWASYGDPSARGWTLDWTTFVMTAQAGAGGANLHVYYWPNPGLELGSHYGGRIGLDRYQRLRPILEELHGLRLAESPRRVAVWQDAATLHAKHRTVFASRRQDLRRWFEQLKDDAVPYEDWRADHADGYRLLVLNPLDEVVSRELVEEVDRRVRAGATVLIAGRCALRCPELDAQPFPLLRRLGVPVPAGTWRMDERGCSAQAAAGSPLLAAGAALPFYSQAELAAELADPGLAQRFWSWPYRWLPRSDYFGRFAGVEAAGGSVLARFPDGGAALSLHPVGKGRALVLWGTPRQGDPALAGFMHRLAAWCDAGDPRAGSPLPRLLEGDNPALGRRYAVVWQDRPGEYPAVLPAIPDGEWFVDELNSGQRLGVYTGAEARRGDLKLAFIDGYSPLKVLRFMPKAQVGADWAGKFRLPPAR
ncbi:MAG: beta-galactosidase [Planctomycetes bacterium]|nr:beta-galactosidase [Planctomycetota bacterium]